MRLHTNRELELSRCEDDNREVWRLAKHVTESAGV